MDLEDEESLLEILQKLYLNIRYHSIIRPYSQPFVTRRFVRRFLNFPPVNFVSFLQWRQPSIQKQLCPEISPTAVQEFVPV